MQIRKRTSFGVVGYNIEDVNLNEMRQMSELNKRVVDVLNSHAEGKERKYIDDNDLRLVHAILSVFTKDYEGTNVSAFDEFLANENKPQPSAPADNEE